MANFPYFSGVKILVTGASGMVGSEVVRQALIDPEIEQITALLRRPLKVEHPKLKTVLHQNFLNYSGLADVFRAQDACLWCLGISQSQVSKEEYHKITYDYAVAGAQAMLAANPEITFLFLSGLGADPTEKSRVLFARVKGKTENALRKLPFKKLYIARPGGIKPTRPKEHDPLAERLWLPLFPLFNFLRPTMFITSEELAKGMLRIAKHGSDNVIVGNGELKRMKETAAMLFACLMVFGNVHAQIAQLDSQRAEMAKLAINGIWTAAQVYYADKGEWPTTVGDLVQRKYVEIDSARIPGWQFKIGGCYPERIWAYSKEIQGRGECPECPEYAITYDILKGRWSGSGVPYYGHDTLSIEQRAELATEAKKALKLIWEGARVYYNDKGEWPETVELLDRESYIGVYLDNEQSPDEPYGNLVSSSTFAQWQFGIIGSPPERIFAVSTEKMPGGAGKAIEYDVKEDKWQGYGMNARVNVVPSPVKLNEYKKEGR